jgi:hypothetical protein
MQNAVSEGGKLELEITIGKAVLAPADIGPRALFS